MHYAYSKLLLVLVPVPSLSIPYHDLNPSNLHYCIFNSILLFPNQRSQIRVPKTSQIQIPLHVRAPHRPSSQI
jgi:hypothetical protein